MVQYEGYGWESDIDTFSSAVPRQIRARLQHFEFQNASTGMGWRPISKLNVVNVDNAHRAQDACYDYLGASRHPSSVRRGIS